jgi:hypothetical protein
MPPFGQHSEAPAFTGEVHGRRAQATAPTAEVERTPEGITPGGHRPLRISVRRGTDSPGEQSSEVARICLSLATPASVANGMRASAPRGARPTERIKAL